MANELKYVVEKTKDNTWKGFDHVRNDMADYEQGRYMIKISKYRRDRSNKQNGFYWGNFIESQIDCFKEYWGETYNQKEIHNWNKSMFWADDAVNEDTGEVYKKPASSTDNNTVEWEIKMENMRQWFRQHFNWELPYPEKQSEIKY